MNRLQIDLLDEYFKEQMPEDEKKELENRLAFDLNLKTEWESLKLFVEDLHRIVWRKKQRAKIRKTLGIKNDKKWKIRSKL